MADPNADMNAFMGQLMETIFANRAAKQASSALASDPSTDLASRTTAAEASEKYKRAEAESMARQLLLKFNDDMSIEDALKPVPPSYPSLLLHALTPRQITEHVKLKDRYFSHKARLFRIELIKYDDDVIGRNEALVRFGDEIHATVFGKNREAAMRQTETTPSSVYREAESYYSCGHVAPSKHSTSSKGNQSKTAAQPGSLKSFQATADAAIAAWDTFDKDKHGRQKDVSKGNAEPTGGGLERHLFSGMDFDDEDDMYERLAYDAALHGYDGYGGPYDFYDDDLYSDMAYDAALDYDDYGGNPFDPYDMGPNGDGFKTTFPSKAYMKKLGKYLDEWEQKRKAGEGHSVASSPKPAEPLKDISNSKDNAEFKGQKKGSRNPNKWTGKSNADAASASSKVSEFFAVAHKQAEVQYVLGKSMKSSQRMLWRSWPSDSAHRRISLRILLRPKDRSLWSDSTFPVRLCPSTVQS